VRSVTAVVVGLTLALSLHSAAAGAALRTHTVTEIRSQPGAAVPTLTLPNGRPERLVLHQTLPDGSRIDVPLRVTVVIASTDAKSITTLRPDTSFTLVSTGAGERSTIGHGSALFSIVHGALTFFQVRYSTKFTASARGTVFSVETAGKNVTFACRRGVVDVAYTARLQIGAGKRVARRAAGDKPSGGAAASIAAPPAVRAVDVIAAATTASVSFPVDAPDAVKSFATASDAQSFYAAQLGPAQQSGDPVRIAAALNNAGIVEDRLGLHDRALATFGEAIRVDPQDAIPFYNRANVYYNNKDYARAIADYSEAIRLDPSYSAAYNNRGNAYDDSGKPELALLDYETAIRLTPQDPMPFYNRGGIFYDKGDYARSIADYNEAIRLDPKDPSAYNNRGDAYDDSGDHDRAIVDYDEAIRLDPSDPFPFFNRAVSYQSKREFARAIADYTESLRLDPKQADAHDRRGASYAETGDHDRALDDFTAALRLDPALTDAYQGRGLEYSVRHDREAALADYAAAIRSDPKTPFPYLFRGLENLYGGPLEQARADFEKTAALMPTSAYPALLVELVDRRSHAPSRLADAAKRFDMTAWPAPLVRLFLGQSTPAQTLAAARHADPARQRVQLCLANYYTAEYLALQGSKGDAVPLYRLAARDCPEPFQRLPARNALEALGVPP